MKYEKNRVLIFLNYLKFNFTSQGSLYPRITTYKRNTKIIKLFCVCVCKILLFR